MTVSISPRLFDSPLSGVYPVEMDEANYMLCAWGHKLGPCKRPFGQEGYCLEVAGKPVAVAVSASIVHGPVAGYDLKQVVELARLAAGERWACRVMIRLWREACAKLWPHWPVQAAVSYSHNAMHSGNLYRFDGWEKIREDCGSSGGGAWSRKRYAGDAHHGKKTLWLWRYVDEVLPLEGGA